MARRTSPVLLRRHLGEQLRRHREAVGRKASEVARELGINPSVISRLENGQRRPVLVYVQALSSAYGLDRSTTDDLMRLAREAYEEGWWERWSVGDQPSEYVGFEAGARVILDYELGYVPGLLQTPGYARAAISLAFPRLSADELGQAVDFRMKRQQILRAEDPVRLHAIIDEGLLHRQFGGDPGVMNEQLTALTEGAALPNVTLQVLQFSAKSGLGLLGGFSVLQFPGDSDQDVAYAETILGAVAQRQEDDVERCKELFSELSSLAADEVESIHIIRSFMS